MRVGFTGTRDGGTDRQLAWLYRLFEDAQRVHGITGVAHGACVGVDASVHALALECELHVDVWPPTNPKYVAVECLTAHPLVTIHPAMPYLNRDREIVKSAIGLVGLPKQDEQPDRALWGGTWYTVDFAERVSKIVTICYPNGRIENRYPSPIAKGQNING